MTLRTIALVGLAAATLSLFAWHRSDYGMAIADHGRPVWSSSERWHPRPPRPIPRIECRHPGQLRLIRFEDRSAQLKCAHSLMVRVSVPG
jgi:hypothetical protein